MKAIVYEKYGPPEVLQLIEVEKPTPKENETLVKVHATSLNDADLDFLRGKMQLSRKPRYKILGSDIAGRIEAVGRNVKQFQPGDDIIVDLSRYGFGAFAEYVCVPEKALLLKSARMTFEEAATLPQAAILALQGLRDKKQIQPREKVLINGAGGGVGTFAVQIAKFFGAEVTGVDSTEKLDMVRSIGADYVIDYTQEDFTKSEQHYDLILDVVVSHSISDFKRVLNPNGILRMVGGSMARVFKAALLGPLISRSKKMSIVVWKPNKKEDMVFLTELIETGKVVPVIDRQYPLSEVAEAFRYLEEGHHKGKIVITVGT
ncbi:MAG: NAD(P)-dependent alcohol dehydrogenase [Promethearchaeota archaeon]|nr:MAG: NAD(P)-dependent alcohol dehydrogenase [Candidatus Lokiarchaeota archaeon]